MDEGNQLITSCNQLKLESPKDGKRYLTDKDGKRYKTDVANTEQLLRIIQSAERVRMACMIWLYSKKGLFERILSDASAATVASKALAPRMLAG